MERLTSEKGPKAIGAYSVATKVGDIIYTSGQIPIDPETNQMVEDDIQAQTHRVMKNLKIVLEENDSQLGNIIKSNVFLSDINEFRTFNEVYEEYFAAGNYPSRTAVQVGALPNNAKVEIDVMATVKK